MGNAHARRSFSDCMPCRSWCGQVAYDTVIDLAECSPNPILFTLLAATGELQPFHESYTSSILTLAVRVCGCIYAYYMRVLNIPVYLGSVYVTWSDRCISCIYIYICIHIHIYTYIIYIYIYIQATENAHAGTDGVARRYTMRGGRCT